MQVVEGAGQKEFRYNIYRGIWLRTVANLGFYHTHLDS